MSNEASSWAFAQEAGGPGPKLLLVALANHAGKDGVTFLGRKRLAGECECREATVTANMAKLEERKLVERVQRRRPNGSRTSNWTVLAPRWKDRGQMVTALDEELPLEIVELTRPTSGSVSVPRNGSGTVFGPGQVRFSGGPEPLGEPSVSSPTPQDDIKQSFVAWLEHHEHVTGHRPSKPTTKAYKATLESYGARLAEGWTQDDLRAATVGAYSDDFRREKGYDTVTSILRPTMVGDLVARGRRWMKEHQPSTGETDVQRAARYKRELQESKDRADRDAEAQVRAQQKAAA